MGLKARGNDAKTKLTKVSAKTFIAGLADETRRAECATLMRMMAEESGAPARMWGTSIVGFGSYDYKYASGREGSWPRAGFSPRKQSLTVYCVPGFASQTNLLSRLGPHKTAVSCLYIKKLADVDLTVLREIIASSLAHMATIYPE